MKGNSEIFIKNVGQKEVSLLNMVTERIRSDPEAVWQSFHHHEGEGSLIIEPKKKKIKKADRELW